MTEPIPWPKQCPACGHKTVGTTRWCDRRGACHECEELWWEGRIRALEAATAMHVDASHRISELSDIVRQLRKERDLMAEHTMPLAHGIAAIQRVVPTPLSADTLGPDADWLLFDANGIQLMRVTKKEDPLGVLVSSVMLDYNDAARVSKDVTGDFGEKQN